MNEWNCNNTNVLRFKQLTERFTTFWPNFFVSRRARRIKAGYSVSSGGGGPSCVEKVTNQPAMYN